MLNVVNKTELHVAWLTGKKEFPQDSFTIVVKGTFKLLPDGGITEICESLPVTGDEFVDYDIKKALTYDSDFAYFKPVADLLLKGTCYTPEAKTLQVCPVTFAVGQQRKTLMIHGARYAKPGIIGDTASSPEPFITMPINYENAYGGFSDKKNPLGKGQDKDQNGIRWLPNVVDPDVGEKEPAGFGPINRSWPQRSAKLGSYNGDYMEKRWPWLPEDFDWSHFNAAPEDMQYSGYLNGDETLYFENLHPEQAQYRSQLPGVRPRCFLHEPEGDDEFREVEMNLDTLWVDMDKEKLVLVWRGVADIKSATYAELSHVYLAKEEILGESLSKDKHFDHFQESLEPTVALATIAATEISPVAETPPAAEEPPLSDSAEDDTEKEMQQALEQCREVMLKAGHTPAFIDELLSAEDPGIVLSAYFERLGVTQEQADAYVAESTEQMKKTLKEKGLSDDDINLLFSEE